MIYVRYMSDFLSVAKLMAAYRRERPQTTESGAVVGPAQSLRPGTVA